MESQDGVFIIHPNFFDKKAFHSVYHQVYGKQDAKKITKLIKDSGLKVQAQIQDDLVRVTVKKIDDLQDVIKL